jgi:thioredoxin-like negative regulator of GroEL
MGKAEFEGLAGRFADARRHQQEARAMLEEVGLDLWVAMSWESAELIEVVEGSFDEILARLPPVVEVLRESDPDEAGTLSMILARAAVELGRDEDASSWLPTAPITDRDVLPRAEARSLEGRIAARAGEANRAEQLGREAVAIMSSTDLLHHRGVISMDLAEILITIGRAEAAVEPLEAAIELLEKKGSVVSAARARDRLSASEPGPGPSIVGSTVLVSAPRATQARYPPTFHRKVRRRRCR